MMKFKYIAAICLSISAISGTIRYNYDVNPEVSIDAVLVDKWVDVRTGKYARQDLMGLYREVGGKENLYEREMSSFNYHKYETGQVFTLKMRKSEYEKSGYYDFLDILSFFGMIMPIAAFLVIGFWFVWILICG